jgi:hypothetical protein
VDPVECLHSPADSAAAMTATTSAAQAGQATVSLVFLEAQHTQRMQDEWVRGSAANQLAHSLPSLPSSPPLLQSATGTLHRTPAR